MHRPPDDVEVAMARRVRWLIGLAMVLWTAVATPLAAQTAGPPVQKLPPIDLLVFLDRSKTIFTGKGGTAPNERIVTMLEKMFNLPIDGGRRTFISTGDRVYLHTFGSTVKALDEIEDAGNRGAVNAALQKIRQNVTPDTKTDFRALFAEISRNPVLLDAANGRLKLVLLASDFVDDPTDRANGPDKTGVCDLLERYKSGSSRIDGEIESVSRLFGQAAQTAGGRPFMGLLIVEPTEADFGKLQGGYRDCILQTVRTSPLSKILEVRPGADSIRYKDVENDADRFADTFVKAVFRTNQPRLAVGEGSVCRPRGQRAECTLNLDNSFARVGNTLSEVRFHTSPTGRPVFQIPAGITLRPGERRPLTLGLDPAQAVALFQSREVFVTLSGQGIGEAQPFPLVVRPPIRPDLKVEVSKNLADRPFEISLSLDNRADEAFLPRKARFFDSADAQVPRIEIPLSSSSAGISAGRADNAIVIPAPDAIGQRFFSASPVLVSVEGLLGDAPNGTEIETPRVPATPPLIRPFDLRAARAEAAPDGSGMFNLALTLTNPGSQNRPLFRIRYYEPERTDTPLIEQTLTDGPTIPAGLPDYAVRIALPEGVRQVVRNGLLVEALDGQAGLPSQRQRLEPPPEERPFQIAAAALRVGTGRDKFKLEVTFRNPGPSPKSVSTVTLLSARSNAPLRRLEVSSPALVIGNGTWLAQFDLDTREYAPILDGGDIAVSCVDSRGQTCAAPFGVQAPAPVPLAIDSVEWRRADGDFPQLALVLRNPGALPNALTGALVENRGPRGDREALPLVDRRVLDSGDTPTTVMVPFPQEFWPRFNPRDPVFVQLQCSRADCSSVSAAVPPLPNVSMDLIPEPGSWRDDVTEPEVAVTVRNPPAYNNVLSSVWASPDGGKTVRLARFASEANPTIAKGNTQIVNVAFPNDMERLLAGDTVDLCIVGLYDGVPGTAPGSFKCPQQWKTVRLPPRKPMEITQRDGEMAFDREGRTLTLQISNPNGVPATALGLDIAPADGKGKPFRKDLPAPGISIKPKATASLRVALTQDEVSQIEQGVTAKVAVVDLSRRNLDSRSLLQGDSVADVQTEHFTVAIRQAVEEKRWSFNPEQGLYPETHFAAHIVLTRQMSDRPASYAFRVWLTNADGKIVARSERDVDVAFKGREAEIRPVWNATRASDIRRPVTVHIRYAQGRRPEGSEPVNWSWYSYIAGNAPALLIIFMVLTGVPVLLNVIDRSWLEGKLTKMIRVDEGDLKKIFDYVWDSVPLSSFFGVVFVGLDLRFGQNSYLDIVICLALTATVAALVLLCFVGKANLKAVRAVTSGQPRIEFPLLYQKLMNEAYVPLVFVLAVALVIWIIMQTCIIPLHSHADINLFIL
jgi:hypothetical protein